MLLLSPCRESLPLLIAGDNIYFLLVLGVPNDSACSPWLWQNKSDKKLWSFGHLYQMCKNFPKSNKIRSMKTTVRSIVFWWQKLKIIMVSGRHWVMTTPQPSAFHCPAWLGADAFGLQSMRTSSWVPRWNSVQHIHQVYYGNKYIQQSPSNQPYPPIYLHGNPGCTWL